MRFVIVNLDSEPRRWATMWRQCTRAGVTPSRFSATPDTGKATMWLGRPVADVTRRQAIVETYQRLVRWLETDDTDEWIILQDDVTIKGPLEAPSGAVLHCFGGWRLFHMGRTNGVYRPIEGTARLVDPTTTNHLCPKGFYVHREIVPMLGELWADRSRQVCESWVPALRRYGTFERVPVIE